MTAITKTTVLDLDPANANWMVTIEREDYADPTEESGVLLSVGRTTVMLTLAEARTIGEALVAAAEVPEPEPAPPAAPAPAEHRVVDLMANLEASLERAKALAAARPKRTPCDGCDGTGTVYGYNCCPRCGPIVELPCDDCGGTGWAA